MKFKSNLKSEAPVDFSALEQDINTLLNVDLCEAVENLDDLVLLHANIEKYGITEPVMDLIGGTLESWNISIQNKEACLEGLGDKLKEGSKKVWEFIKQIIDKIRLFIKKLINGRNPEQEKKIVDLVKQNEKKGSEISCDGIPHLKIMKDLIELSKDSYQDVNSSTEIWAKSYPSIFKLGDSGQLEISDEITTSMNDTESDYKKKGYSTPHDVVLMCVFNTSEAMKRIDNVCDFLLKEVATYSGDLDGKDSSAGEIERRKRFGDRARSLLAGFSKVVPILNRIHNSGMKYGRKFHGESEEK